MAVVIWQIWKSKDGCETSTFPLSAQKPEAIHALTRDGDGNPMKRVHTFAWDLNDPEGGFAYSEKYLFPPPQPKSIWERLKEWWYE